MSRVGDRFVLVREIGSGGMSTVYLGRDEVLDRPVAVKILHPDLDDEETGELFRREGRMAARLSHPNIVQVYDAGEDDLDGREVSYIVMEYLSGGDLKALMDRGGALPEGMLSRVGADIAAGLAHAHARGVVHRDVKPQNVLLDDQGNPKLTDFGIARALDTTHETRAGSYLGTAAYSSPEQLRGDGVTPKSDVYSLGTTLYHAAAGRPPFTGAPIEVANQQILKKPIPPRERGASIGDGLEDLVLDCLEKDPERRPDASRVHEKLLRRSEASAPTRGPVKTKRAGLSRAVGAAKAARTSGPGSVRRRLEGRGSRGLSEPPEITISVPTRTFRAGSRQRTVLAVLMVAVVLLVLMLAGAWAMLGSGEEAGRSSGPGRDKQDQAAAPGPDQGPLEEPAGQPGQEPSNETAQNPSGGGDGASEEDPGPTPPLTKAERTVFNLYYQMSFARPAASWAYLSPRLQDEIGSQQAWAEQEDIYTFTYMEFIRYPQASAAGETARVPFEVRLDHTWGSEVLSGTWVCVNEDGEWKLDRLENEKRIPA